MADAPNPNQPFSPVAGGQINSPGGYMNQSPYGGMGTPGMNAGPPKPGGMPPVPRPMYANNQMPGSGMPPNMGPPRPGFGAPPPARPHMGDGQFNPGQRPPMMGGPSATPPPTSAMGQGAFGRSSSVPTMSPSVGPPPPRPGMPGGPVVNGHSTPQPGGAAPPNMYATPPGQPGGFRPPTPVSQNGPPGPAGIPGMAPPRPGGPPPMGGMRPPTSQGFPGGPPPMSQPSGQPPPRQQSWPGMPPPMGGMGQTPPPQGGIGQTPPPGVRPPGPPMTSPDGQQTPNNVPPSVRPNELPVPYQGQGQYQQNRPASTPGLTPGSGPPSQKSSRAPSPIPGQQYDALEGQFSPPTPGGMGASPAFPGGPPLPTSSAPGQVPPPVSSFGQAPPPPSSMGYTGMPPPPGGQDMNRGGITGRRQYPQMPGYPQGPPQPGATPPIGTPGQVPPPGQPGPSPQGNHVMPGQPGQQPGMYGQNNTAQQLPGQFNRLNLQGDATRPVNLLQERHLIPPEGAETPAPNLPHDFKKVNCHPEVFRCTVNAIPHTQGLLNKSRLPLGILIHPFKDLADVPVLSVTEESPYQTLAPSVIGEENVKGDVETNPPPPYSKVGDSRRGDRTYLYNKRGYVTSPAIEGDDTKSPTTEEGDTKSPTTEGEDINSPTAEGDDTKSPSIEMDDVLKDLFGDNLPQLPVIQSSVIVRCRSCRTYINPFVSFVDMRRWKCNLCYRVNELPEEFNYDPVSKTYGEPQRRPEIRSATIEFIAPSEYMLRPPQPAVYLYVLDVSFNAVGTGYLQAFCQTLLEELDRIPGDGRTKIGFLTFDRSLHFYNLAEGLSQPQMLVVSDVDDIFLPCPDNLLVNLQESKELVTDLLSKLPEMFATNTETGSALGAALQAAYKLMSATGGRVSVFQTQLPTVGPGALKCREDPNERAGKKVQHLGPATDFYKKLALDCSAQQIAVDLFMLSSQYADLATIAGVSKYSGGSINYFPGYHSVSNPAEVDRFEALLRRYISRKIGFEAVMRIRCTRGLQIHTFHGNFFVRSTDLLSLPNINPDAGFGMQISIDDTLECNHVCFQAALLYTSSKGERRIRVHTLCLPVTQAITEIYAAADQQAIIGLISKMAVDKSLTSMSDARDAAINAAIDMLGSYGSTLTAAQRLGQLPCPTTLRLLPLYILSMLKSTAFRVGSSTKLDDRVFALESCKTLPLVYLIQEMHPDLYPVHALDDRNGIDKDEVIIPQPPVIQLSSGNMDRHGAYVMDAGSRMFLWIGAAVSDKFCQEALDMPNFSSIPDGLSDLPELENPTSERLRLFVSHLNDQKPSPAAFYILREDSRQRMQFLQYMVEDRTESTFSYYEFLQHLQKEVKS